MIKISVIMPVYNSEEYLEWAAESVLKQNLKEIELIMVDDGSKDKSGQICDNLKAKDDRVKVIHQKNQGISAARNNGMKAAQGEYIAFIDNDDAYVEGFLDKIYEYAKENDANILKYGYRVIEDWNKDEKAARTRGFDKTRKVGFENLKKDYQKLKDDGFFNMIWNGIYKRSLIEENNIYFPEDVKKGYEDWIFNYHLLECVTENIFVWQGIEYNHYQRGAHSTSSQYYDNQQMALIMAAKEEYKLVQVLEEKYKGKINWNRYAMDYFLEAILMFERKNCHVQKKEKKEYLSRFRGMEEFSCLISESARKDYSVTKKMVADLLKKKHYGLLLTVSHWYNYFIVYKRKKKYS